MRRFFLRTQDTELFELPHKKRRFIFGITVDDELESLCQGWPRECLGESHVQTFVSRVGEFFSQIDSICLELSRDILVLSRVEVVEDLADFVHREIVEHIEGPNKT